MSSLYAKENVLINSKGVKVELVYSIKKLIRLISQVSCKRRKSSNNPPCSRCIVRIRDDHDHDEHVQVCPLSTCRYYCVCVCVYVCCFCVCVCVCDIVGAGVYARAILCYGGVGEPCHGEVGSAGCDTRATRLVYSRLCWQLHKQPRAIGYLQGNHHNNAR